MKTLQKEPDKELAKELYDILIYIVEPTIKPDDLKVIIDKQIMPAIEKYKEAI